MARAAPGAAAEAGAASGDDALGLLALDRIGLEIGYRLIPLVQDKSGTGILDHVAQLRRRFAQRDGIVLPAVRIKDNVRKGMEARGYRYVEASPDLQVNFQGVVQDRTDVFSMPRSDIQWFYNYRRNSYVAVPVWYDDTQVSRYREGTLTVDLVDARRNRMVWTGAAIGRVVKKTPEEKMAEVDQAINAIFLQYPHRAATP